MFSLNQSENSELHSSCNPWMAFFWKHPIDLEWTHCSDCTNVRKSLILSKMSGIPFFHIIALFPDLREKNQKHILVQEQMPVTLKNCIFTWCCSEEHVKVFGRYFKAFSLHVFWLHILTIWKQQSFYQFSKNYSYDRILNTYLHPKLKTKKEITFILEWWLL